VRWYSFNGHFLKSGINNPEEVFNEKEKTEIHQEFKEEAGN